MKYVAATSGKNLIFRRREWNAKGIISEFNNPGPAQKEKNALAVAQSFLGHAPQARFRYNPSETRRDGRAAEGGGLLNRYRVKSSIGGSNPPLSATLQSKLLI